MTADLLQEFSDAAVIDAADIQVAQRLSMLVGEADETVMLAVALLVRGLRNGSVCVDLQLVAEHHEQADAQDVSWPEPTAWLAAV
ncbi:MAG: exodeoxyribonuclease V subunit alpha, partial [Mycobacterium sp.]